MKSVYSKQVILFVVLNFLIVSTFAQFGGGTGTETDPYQIWNKAHWDELSDSFNIWLSDSTYNTCSDSTGFEGVHFRLMADIDEEVEKAILVAYKYDTISWIANEIYFNGFFHGAGHHINVKTSVAYQINTRQLFFGIGPTGYLDSLEIIGNPTNFGAMVNDNFGTIYACTCNLTITSAEIINPSPWIAGICNNNGGKIISCVNKMSLSLQVGGGVAGICLGNYGEVRNCKNMGNLYIRDGSIGGIVHGNGGLIINCINYGDLSSGDGWSALGGISASINTEVAAINNCINIGNISSSMPQTAGILGFVTNGCGTTVENCANYGEITSTSSECGGIVGALASYHFLIRNNINVARTSGSAINIANSNGISNNYYDKQMCLSKGIGNADIPNIAEGRLTTQLVGNSPALQSLLGNGWSYAVGRYPIPLGLENDSLALLAATPVYLYADNETSYNHVDSVNRNFTVGLENNVSWENAFDRVNILVNNVSLLSIGDELLTVKNSEYEKKVNIIIRDLENINISENPSQYEISIYPNPASDNLILNLKGINVHRIEIFNCFGKSVMKDEISEEKQKISINNLSSGVYFLKVFNANGIVAYKKFVKN